MSLDIGAVQPGQGARPASSTTASAPPGPPASASAASASEESVALETLPLSPPPELDAEIAAAAQAHSDLEAAGQRLNFSLDPQSGKLKIELQDLSGNTLSAVSPSQVLDIAGGGSVG